MNIVRWLLGERPGMTAGRRRGSLSERIDAILTPKIMIQTQALLADVSFYQANIDFAKMKAAGVKGVIIRAGQRTWKDTRFDENWSKSKLAGLPRGSYWFYDSRADPKGQAALWWSIVKERGELFHVADLEESYGGAYGAKAHFKEFILEFQRLSGTSNKYMAIYTGYYWWGTRVGNDPFFKSYPLWLAWYSSMSNVRVPLPWTDGDLKLWQYTSSGDGVKYGVSSDEIDLNWYSGTEAEYNSYFGLTAEPPPPGGTMAYYEIMSNSSSSRSIRSGYSVNFSKVGDLPSGAKAKAGTTEADAYVHPADGLNVKKGDIWRKVYEVNGVPLTGWIAEIHLGQVMITKRLVDDPPPPAQSDIVSVRYSGEVVFDYTDGRQEVFRIEDAEMKRV